MDEFKIEPIYNISSRRTILCHTWPTVQLRDRVFNPYWEYCESQNHVIVMDLNPNYDFSIPRLWTETKTKM